MSDDRLESLRAEIKRIERAQYLRDAYDRGDLWLAVPFDESEPAMVKLREEWPFLNISFSPHLPGRLSMLWVQEELDNLVAVSGFSLNPSHGRGTVS